MWSGSSSSSLVITCDAMKSKRVISDAKLLIDILMLSLIRLTQRTDLFNKHCVVVIPVVMGKSSQLLQTICYFS